VIDYIMIATAPTPLSDELEILIAWRGDPADAEVVIRERLRGELKVSPELSADHTAGDSVSWRFQRTSQARVFLDRRNLSTKGPQ